jgi:hypothetical protein
VGPPWRTQSRGRGRCTERKVAAYVRLWRLSRQKVSSCFPDSFGDDIDGEEARQRVRVAEQCRKWSMSSGLLRFDRSSRVCRNISVLYCDASPGDGSSRRGNLRRASGPRGSGLDVCGPFVECERLAGVGQPTLSRCVCCGYRTGCTTCPVCYWTEDGRHDLDARAVNGSRNGDLSLAEARLNFSIYGASALRYRDVVRPPRADERP